MLKIPQNALIFAYFLVGLILIRYKFVYIWNENSNNSAAECQVKRCPNSFILTTLVRLFDSRTVNPSNPENSEPPASTSSTKLILTLDTIWYFTAIVYMAYTSKSCQPFQSLCELGRRRKTI